jgi:hypothetical protein
MSIAAAQSRPACRIHRKSELPSAAPREGVSGLGFCPDRSSVEPGFAKAWELQQPRS